MDYEKAYKAVLKTATQWIKDGCTDKEKICLECVFPGLRESESEDERIRKWIITELKDSLHEIETMYSGDYDNRDEEDKKRQAYLNKALAYLEKQKEQKPISQEDFDTAKHEALWGEQKPADDKAFEEWLDDWYQGSKEAGGYVMMSESEFKNWSRGIKNMYQQKPAWSEEDEKMIDTIVYVLGQYIDYKVVSGTGSGYATPRYSKEIDWLKSLRPSWKPSDQDELMKLKYAGTSTKLD